MIRIEAECKACRASGIFAGAYEQDGAGLVCDECNGTGKVMVEYTPFEGRKKRDDVKKVFLNTKHMISGNMTGGASYEDWLSDPNSIYKPENAPRGLICPYEHDIHTPTATPNIPLWNQCEKLLTPGKLITTCPFYYKKSFCWKQFDDETETKKED